ncbi:hypothetical protein D187_003268 [Cystobacter fuscus DSM 2262]|uniref:DUF1634 domain-containing protein n=1 Tax=Cystobacter fuscus (strain ATCC 25194 / DSM 2262 / NBRC 100088 / M29) TaxID=1242864 RepID=S9PPY1_CYSF2|nr:hypothetical protein [Cystobacter fuscus]EPX64532.1 hypothetical protein D187_003268 [Cystobacter fuscus DSM 2262]
MAERGEVMTKNVSVPVAQWVPQEVPQRVISGSFPVVPHVPATTPTPEHIARAEAGERWISRLLRGGAACSGALFLTSLALESLPDSEPVHVAIDVLRKGAASALLVTPVVRLVVAGTTLGIRGEWRYAAYAAGVLGLLAVAVGAGFHA